LPTGFQRICHYGLLANCYGEVKLDHCGDIPARAAHLSNLTLLQLLAGLLLR
jgi:hypothetical protein